MKMSGNNKEAESGRESSVTDILDAPERWGTFSAKWDLLCSPYGPDSYPLSVADMELQTSTAIKNALRKILSTGMCGYSEVFDEALEVAVQWQKRRHRWAADVEDVLFIDRTVQALAAVCSHIQETRIHPRVVSLTPTYHPLIEVIQRHELPISYVSLRINNNKFSIDWDELRSVCAESDLLILTNPHNPTGRVWTAGELSKLSHIASETGITIFCDDIHADIVRGNFQYIPLPKAAPGLWEEGNTILVASPGKAFNIAGLQSAVVFAKPYWKNTISTYKRLIGLHNPNCLALPALVAAWNGSSDRWLDQVNQYIDDNVNYTVQVIRKKLPKARCYSPEGTYLIWVDLSSYLGNRCVKDIEFSARVAVSEGTEFGAKWDKWMRLNIAVPRHHLSRALDKLIAVILTTE